MGKLVRLIGSGIGLAAEAIAARRSPSPSGASSSRRTVEDPPPPYVDLPEERADELIAKGQAVPADRKIGHSEDEGSDSDSSELDEADWELDEAGNGYADEENEHSERQAGAGELVQSFLAQHPPPYTPAKGRLPCPVIIPQRRPKDKSRGFVRAYAPVLMDCGIDQATFLDFLKSFHKASQASPVYTVINLAAVGVGFVPEVAAQVTAAVVQVTVGIAKAVQIRERTNSFLDQMNDKLFRPHGLFCLIMTYKPQQKASHEQVDISKTIAKSITPSDSKVREQLKGLKLSSAKTYGELEMPESAPLIFPALDAAAASADHEGKKQSRFKNSSKFVADYLDRRAQASYAKDNPNSTLAADQSGTTFASRYSDPNHPASSGSLVALVTGGALVGGRERRRLRREERGRRPRRERKGGLKKRLLQQDVLYLMIVNMPTDEEIEAARLLLAK